MRSHPCNPCNPWSILCLVLFCALPASAADQEGCLTCHQYRGLARVDKDGKKISLFHTDPDYYSQDLGPHARIRCTGCHDRSEVLSIPHKPVANVDCTRTCHLGDSTTMERRFGHDRITKMLSGSVHTAEVLDKCNDLLGKPLAAGQSRCLLCHDEPTFRQTGENWTARETPLERCSVCHDEQLPIDARLNYWHVHARSQPARSKQDIVRVCAVCHSNENVRKQFNLPDVTVSYLASFHGKAVQLGSQQTASCLDCHAVGSRNVHTILSKKVKASPTNPDQLAATCRSPECHRSAGPQLSRAAVHLELSRGRGIEYLVACLFVVLIASTFGPSALIGILKLLHIVVGREDPRHHDFKHTAEKLMADPASRAKLKRFTPHQRFQHWLLVILFGTLVITGFPIKFADRAWAKSVIDIFGGLSHVRLLHRYAGVALMAGFGYHIIYFMNHLRQQKRKTGKGWIKSFLALPMVMSPADMKEMMHLMAYMLFLRKDRPVAGRFNPEEKFEYFGVFWGVMLLGTTGIMMWANEWTTRHLTGRVLTIALLFHSFEAFLALLHVGILHIATVVFSPAVFPLSKAMATGDTPVEELAEAHAGLVMQVAAESGVNHG